MSETGFWAPVAVHFNELIRYVQEISPRTGRGVITSRTPNGTVLNFDQNLIEAGSVLNQYKLKEIFGDYIRCHSWDGTTEGADDVYIAKPFRLRRTPFDGQTIAFSSDGDSYSVTYAYASNTHRTATISGAAENQIVIPRYKVDFDIIYAMEVEETTGVVNAAGEAITILDINADGRAWAKQ